MNVSLYSRAHSFRRHWILGDFGSKPPAHGAPLTLPSFDPDVGTGYTINDFKKNQRVSVRLNDHWYDGVITYIANTDRVDSGTVTVRWDGHSTKEKSQMLPKFVRPRIEQRSM